MVLYLENNILVTSSSTFSMCLYIYGMYIYSSLVLIVGYDGLKQFSSNISKVATTKLL